MQNRLTLINSIKVLFFIGLAIMGFWSFLFNNGQQEAKAKQAEAKPAEISITTELKEAPVPVIGISGQGGTASNAAAVASIRAMGVIPLMIANHKQRIKDAGGDTRTAAMEVFQHLDGLMIMGSDNDVPAAMYNEEQHPETKVGDVPRIQFESALLDLAAEKQMPALGICRGLQLMAVKDGAKLIQHLPDLLGNNGHMQELNGAVPIQYVDVTKNSKLGEALDGIETLAKHRSKDPTQLEFQDNSFHHQAIDPATITENSNYIVSAHADDGVVEGIEHKSLPWLGVQWHPEFGASQAGKLLFSDLIEKSSEHALRREKPASLEAVMEETKRSFVKQAEPTTVQKPPAIPADQDASLWMQRVQGEHNSQLAV